MSKASLRNFIIFDLVVLVVIGLFVYPRFFKDKDTDSIHYHAGFQVYQDGQLLDFSSVDYMNLVPCGEHATPGDNKYEQQEKAHLHDNVGDVVHVHRAGATWNDLFFNIEYPLPAGSEGYVNGTAVNNLLAQPIIENQSVVFFVGENRDKESKVQNRVTLERIQEISKQSENCAN